MSKLFNFDSFNVKQPLSTEDNRDENYLIEVVGNWIPECDIVYYGLLNSEYSNILYKLRTKSKFEVAEIYREICYFTGRDLIRYLASTNDDYEDLDDEFINKALQTAYSNYMYVPCNESMLRHAIIETAYLKFVKSITLVYPWEPRPIDIQYIRRIIPPKIITKFNFANGSITEIVNLSKKDSHINGKFTTIILNSMEELIYLIDNANSCKTDEAFFLLRNHSENTDLVKNDDGKFEFVERNNMSILNKLLDFNTGVPKSQMRFARYEPTLFIDQKKIVDDGFLGK